MVEIEKEGSLPVMDVFLHRGKTGKADVSIYRKLTHTERYLLFSSHHPLSMKQSVMGSLLHGVDYISEEGTIGKEKEVSFLYVMKGVKERKKAPTLARRKGKKSGSATGDRTLSCVIICGSVHRITSYGVGRC